MRIGDWSSDVCSSDLRARQEVPSAVTGGDGRDGGYADPNLAHSTPSLSEPTMVSSAAVAAILSALASNPSLIPIERSKPARMSAAVVPVRSEEHTSELQSLMRISYAVFCLKKKNKIT